MAKSVIKNKKTTRNNKTNKKRIYKSKGGAPDGHRFIKAGTYGCAYKPNFKCLDPTLNMSTSDGSISKLMRDRDSAMNELAESECMNILEYDLEYKFHLPSPTICQLDPRVNPDYNLINFPECLSKIRMSRATLPYILNYQYGGVDLDVAQNNKEFGMPRYVFSEKGLQNILNGIIELQKKGLSHSDLKSLNIVTGYMPYEEYQKEKDDEKRHKLINDTTNYKLIDFGFLSLIEDIDLRKFKPIEAATLSYKNVYSGPNKQFRNNFFYLAEDYPYYPSYGLFISKSLRYYDSLNQSIEEQLKKKIRDKVKFFIYDPKIDIEVKVFYESIGLNEDNQIYYLYDMFNTLKEKSKNPSEYPSEYYDLELTLGKKVDFFSFGIILLEYLNSIRIHLSPVVFSIVQLYIYYFLHNSQILYSLINPINLDDIQKFFIQMCNDMLLEIDQIEKYKQEFMKQHLSEKEIERELEKIHTKNIFRKIDLEGTIVTDFEKEKREKEKREREQREREQREKEKREIEQREREQRLESVFYNNLYSLKKKIPQNLEKNIIIQKIQNGGLIQNPQSTISTMSNFSTLIDQDPSRKIERMQKIKGLERYEGIGPINVIKPMQQKDMFPSYNLSTKIDLNKKMTLEEMRYKISQVKQKPIDMSDERRKVPELPKHNIKLTDDYIENLTAYIKEKNAEKKSIKKSIKLSKEEKIREKALLELVELNKKTNNANN